MRKDTIAITTTTLLLIIYCSFASLNVAFMWVNILFVTLHILSVWMVIAILKSPVKVERTFDEYFYQDENKRRNNPTING